MKENFVWMNADVNEELIIISLFFALLVIVRVLIGLLHVFAYGAENFLSNFHRDFTRIK